MWRLVSLAAVILAVAGCGDTTKGDDSDPTGSYRFSHSRTYGLLMMPALPISVAPPPVRPA